MAIIPRKFASGTVYQVRIQDADGRWISNGNYKSKRDAENANQKLKNLKQNIAFSSTARRATVADYFDVWFEATNGTGPSQGWRDRQRQMFRDYVEPIMGGRLLHEVKTADALKVMQLAKNIGRANSTCGRIYSLLHKLFQDAVDLHELLDRNPIKKKIRPQIVEKEAEFFTIDETRRVAAYVEGKPYELAVWLQLFVGCRVGEIQALLWDNVDLVHGIIHIRRTLVRNESREGKLVFREYPKGKRWHDVPVPAELLLKLREAKTSAKSEYVATSPSGTVIIYLSYLKTLKRYCLEAGVKQIATHGLRHSTAELWMSYGAGREDIQAMFAHSSSNVTDRYIHSQATKQLERFSNVVRLFPESSRKSSRSDENRGPDIQNQKEENTSSG